MPIASKADLQVLIKDGVISAISVDTSVFEKYQFGFEVGVLAQLEQFQQSPVRHLLCNVVLEEVRRHLSAKAEHTFSQVKNSFKPLGNHWNIDKKQRDEILARLFPSTSLEHTNARLAQFLESTGAKVLDCGTLVSADYLLNLYHSVSPPFGTTEAKKSEFPDAFALCALEKWAADNQTKVLVVSKDKDWMRYCEGSDRIFYVDELPDALSACQFNAEETLARFKAAVLENKVDGLEEILADSINDQIDAIDMDFEAASSWYYEAEPVDLKAELNAESKDIAQNCEAVDFSEGVLTLRASVPVSITAQFSVSFEAWDGIDREYVPMGSADVSDTVDAEVEILITVSVGAEFEIVEARLAPSRVHIDFGEIEPDWM